MPILTEDERIGTVLAGKYRVRAVLARGGMGVLFTGEHTWTGRAVAIKLLPPAHTSDTTATQRFLREGRAATTLRHPHVVEVLDMGQAEDGALFMVLELLEGIDLSAVLRFSGAMHARDAIELITPIVDALATVHERGFVHRDLKPSNVYLARQGDGGFLPKLLDFGIAKALGGEDTSATSSGIIVGTPHYMAPEQATGTSEVGPPADLWALGVLLYELVSGSLPYDGPSPTAILLAVLQRAHTPLIDVAPSTPAAVAEGIERALARDPADRPRDLRAWITSLRAAAEMPALALPLHTPLVVQSEAAARAIGAKGDARSSTDRPPPFDPVAARAQANVVTDRPPARRLPWVAAAGAAGALVLVAIVVAVAVSSSAPEPTVRELAVPPIVATTVIDAGAPAIQPVAIVPAEPADAPVEAEAEAPSRPQAPSRGRPERVRPGEEHGRGRRPIAEITTEW